MTLPKWVKANPSLWLLATVLLLGAFLRFYDLGAESIWLDESTSVHISKQTVPSIIRWLAKDVHPPLYYIALHYWMLVFGTTEVAVRSLSAVFGVASIFLIYQVGRQLFNRHVGLLGSFLLAISWFHIYYSQEARTYTLLALLTLLSFSLFINILKARDTRNWHLVCYFLTNLCLAYTHYFGPFVIASQIVYFILLWDRHKHVWLWFLGVQIATVGFFAPWIPVVIGQGARVSEGFWIPQASIMRVVGAIGTYVGSGWGKVPLLIVFFVLCLIGLLTIRRLDGRWTWRKPLQSTKGLSWKVSLESVDEVLLLLIWFVFLVVVPFLISQVFTSFYVGRYTIGASPALYLLAARAVGGLNRQAAYAGIVVIVLLSLPGLQHYYAHDVKPQWREIAMLIEDDSEPNDVIMTCPSHQERAFDYYYKGELERFGMPWNITEKERIASRVDKAVAGKERLWLISHRQANGTVVTHLMDSYGKESLILEKEYLRVRVYLFDVHIESVPRDARSSLPRGAPPPTGLPRAL